jgi:pilus assembly protein CpaB
MQKQRIMLIVGVALAIVAVFLIKVFLDQQRKVLQEEASREAAQSQASRVSVLVAKQDIPQGTTIASGMVETKILSKQSLVPQVATSLDRIAGMITIAPIVKDEQISLSKLAYARQAGGLAEVTPVGKRAITITVDTVAGLAGMIKPGDYVDLIAILQVPVQLADGKQVNQVATMPLFQNVLVLAVGQQTGGFSRETGRYSEAKEEKKESGGGYSLITLALNPQEANLIAFIQEQGKIRLVLRSPADSQISQTQIVTPNNLAMFLQHLFPKEASQPEVQKEETRPTGYVEIYRGLKKEKVPLSK